MHARLCADAGARAGAAASDAMGGHDNTRTVRRWLWRYCGACPGAVRNNAASSRRCCFCCLVASSTLPSLATPILPGAETGMIVALMPPDAPTPTGGYCIPAMATDGLLLGDTVGATPGAYGCVLTPRRVNACIGLRTFHPLSCLPLHRLIHV